MAQSVSFNINLKVNGKDAVRSVSVDLAELRRAITETKTSAEKTTTALIGFNQSVDTIRNVSGIVQQMAGVLNTLTEEGRTFGDAMADANTMARRGFRRYGLGGDADQPQPRGAAGERGQLCGALYTGGLSYATGNTPSGNGPEKVWEHPSAQRQPCALRHLPERRLLQGRFAVYLRGGHRG